MRDDINDVEELYELENEIDELKLPVISEQMIAYFLDCRQLE